MESHTKILNAVKYVGAFVLTLGITLFFLGVFGIGSSVMASIGIGTIIGAVFIFLMGVFFVATEEVLDKTESAS
ncbi:small-conductance mechanosensitive channel [Salirhabdus euzebyi]|uniref:Small-conductance mechanosensitive channel n=1 Tax=Salirhabdus euzebyi TaxID=394506 RepID=A0A841Q4D6_9BACI|nr:hypothetical protein [Salirhabdus euzebyi]MBB6453223.1 small-conductance mechanosensitive channel [Salirhabdus euzebyi]